jgi:hypothetical protein
VREELLLAPARNRRADPLELAGDLGGVRHALAEEGLQSLVGKRSCVAGLFGWEVGLNLPHAS